MNPADKAIPCPIGELPDELLAAIVSYLEIKRGPIANREAEAGRQKENTLTVLGIHALILTCRKLNAIATPSLYQCIVFSQTPTRLVKFLLRTLIEKAELCRYIQYIESPECALHWHKIRSRESRSPHSLKESDMTIYGDYLSTFAWSTDPLDFSLCESFSRNLQHLSRLYGLFGRLKVATLCLIAIAQNLSQAVITPEWYYSSVFACKRYCPINPLRTIWIYAPNSGPLHLRRYDAGCQCTKTQLIKLLEYERGESLRPSTASVEMDKMSLYGKHVDKHVFGHVMLPFTALKHFECRWRNIGSLPSFPTSNVSWESATKFDLPAYRNVLLALRDSLEVLTLDIMDAPYQFAMNQDIHAFGSFREFTSLKQLNVSDLVIFGDCVDLDRPRLSAILPESLETLSINTEWDEPVEDALMNFYTDLSTTPSQLRTLECIVGEPAPKLVAEKLVATFQKIRVKFMFSNEETMESIY
ncbi:uncharacterized protein yc1106_05851 [Curvularia clavata]|uniref:Leucine-rich repeat domain-containing protein n=1 Tax=Curvularia clavata TaxID=95742 RepID=A0A9Q9DTA4_CURCL|nr:uncharacterized protein yc1106_05851 [Curvularia clavata]